MECFLSLLVHCVLIANAWCLTCYTGAVQVDGRTYISVKPTDHRQQISTVPDCLGCGRTIVVIKASPMALVVFTCEKAYPPESPTECATQVDAKGNSQQSTFRCICCSDKCAADAMCGVSLRSFAYGSGRIGAPALPNDTLACPTGFVTKYDKRISVNPAHHPRLVTPQRNCVMCARSMSVQTGLISTSTVSFTCQRALPRPAKECAESIHALRSSEVTQFVCTCCQNNCTAHRTCGISLDAFLPSSGSTSSLLNWLLVAVTFVSAIKIDFH